MTEKEREKERERYSEKDTEKGWIRMLLHNKSYIVT